MQFRFLKLIPVLVLILSVSSCNDDKELENLFDDEAELKSLTASPTATTGYGQTIPMKDVTPCLDKYDTTMLKHAFKLEPIPVNAGDTTVTVAPMQITSYESFRGHELLKFLKRAAHLKRVIGGGYYLTVRIQLGIYTEEYLKKHVTLETEKENKRNRVGIFLVTRRFQKNGEKMLPLEPGDDDIAFDLGDLRP
jgi:hypothetical protein